MISWRDYEGLPGFSGMASAQEVADLNKALDVGSAINAPGSVVAGDGFALRVESLERTLRNLTFRAEHIKLWKLIPKMAAYNTVEEYNRLLSYGNMGSGLWMSVGGLPQESDSSYERVYAQIKYKGIMRRVTDVSTMVNSAIGNVIAQETQNGTMELMRDIERDLFFGRASLDSVQWDGLEAQIEAGAGTGTIIDMRGQPLNEEVLIDAALTIQDAPNFGTPTHLFMNPKVHADLLKTFFPKARYDLFDKAGEGMVGLGVRGYTSPAGDVQFVPNVFLDDGGGVSGLGAAGNAALRPASPTISTAAAAGASGASQFVASDAGNYFFWVRAVNQFGASAPVQVNAATLAVAAGDAVTVGVTPGGGNIPAFYEVYRTLAGGAASTARRILRVANTAGAGALTITDVNAAIPGCTTAFLFQMNSDNMSFKQLAPLVRRPLAAIDTSIRWLQLLYGTPVVYSPRRNVIFRNVGRAVGYVGAP